jgi:hypothetical protein
MSRKVSDLLGGPDRLDRRRMSGLGVAVRPHPDGRRFNAFVDGNVLGTYSKRSHAWTGIRTFYKNYNQNDLG